MSPPGGEDQALVQRVARGESAALEALYRRHAPRQDREPAVQGGEHRLGAVQRRFVDVPFPPALSPEGRFLGMPAPRSTGSGSTPRPGAFDPGTLRVDSPPPGTVHRSRAALPGGRA